MKYRFAALLLAVFCLSLFTGCASVRALERSRISPEPAAKNVQISKEDAIDIALGHAELTEDQVSFLFADFGYDDGRPEFDVDFHYDGWEYDYEIHAETGKILRSERDFEERKPTAPPATEVPVAAQPPVTEAPVVAQPAEPTAPAEKALLTKDEARDIALKHAGLSAADVSRLRVEFDYDDGRPEYDVDFRHGNYEYDYEIHAETGKIITSDKDWDD